MTDHKIGLMIEENKAFVERGVVRDLHRECLCCGRQTPTHHLR
jgi:hypothetical protein